MPKPICLIILDGFGYRKHSQYNAIAAANTPNLDHYFAHHPHSYISGSGHDVGLPEGQMGNSEVGHLNIGAGRMVPQALTRIDMAITNGSFFENTSLCQAVDTAIANNKAVHVLGLLSTGGVHSHENQILAALQLADLRGAKRLYFHAILDGRDTAPKSASASLQKIKDQGIATIASLIGRFYAMDRDNRWDRITAAYDLLTANAATHHFDDAQTALEAAYARGETDEFVTACTLTHGVAIAPGDSVIFMNFRADRARHLTNALSNPHFNEFKRQRVLQDNCFVTLTQYHQDFKVNVAYPPKPLKNTLGQYIADHGLRQLRIAETEKYAHVTFFFNGGIDTPNKNEDRILVPSPQVETYDLQPEMSAYQLTDQLIEAIKEKNYDVIICNYANPDMVGHTGNFEATVKAIETVDTCVGQVITALQAAGGEAIITADHGNAELMYNEKTGQAHTAHTSEPVPVLYIGRKARLTKHDGVLADLAPSLLYLMGLEKPPEMTGEHLFEIE